MNKKEKSLIRPISEEGRRAFDDSYQQIRIHSKKTVTKKSNYKKHFGIGIGVAAAITFILLGTPVGLAVGKLLGFDKFESETLKANHFILDQNASVTDQKITMSLVEIYGDEHELGFHIQAELPKHHLLLKEGLSSPTMSFLLVDSNGQNVMNGANDIGMKKWSYLDKESGILDFFCSLNSLQANLDLTTLLADARLEIYRIGAFYEKEKEEMKPGFHELKGEDIEGKWVLNIDTSQLTHFETLTYLPQKDLSIQGFKLLVSPTKVMIEFSSESVKEQGIDWKSNLSSEAEPKLVAFKGDESKELIYEGQVTPWPL